MVSDIFSEVTIDCCLFSGNHGTYGGAVTLSGNVMVKNSNFTQNHAYVGVRRHGITILPKILHPNRAVNGGAANLVVAPTKLEFDNCHFIENTATQGGALYSAGAVPLLQLSGSSFLRNSGMYCEFSIIT